MSCKTRCLPTFCNACHICLEMASRMGPRVLYSRMKVILLRSLPGAVFPQRTSISADSGCSGSCINKFTSPIMGSPASMPTHWLRRVHGLIGRARNGRRELSRGQQTKLSSGRQIFRGMLKQDMASSTLYTLEAHVAQQNASTTVFQVTLTHPTCVQEGSWSATARFYWAGWSRASHMSRLACDGVMTPNANLWISV